MRFSVAWFGVRVSVMFHLMFFLYTFSSVLVAVWPTFGLNIFISLHIYNIQYMKTYMMATFWEIAGRSFDHMFSLSFVYL